MTSESQSSIASLTQELDFLAVSKMHWAADGATEIFGSLQPLFDWASVLRTTLSKVEASISLLREDYTHRFEILFDEPMDELRRNIQAMRDDYEGMLREEIVPTSPQQQVIHERVPPMCVLFETYVAVNGERMRLPPDVMEGIIPMVGRGKSRVFYRKLAHHEMDSNSDNLDYSQEFVLPVENICWKDLSNTLQQHKWCVLPPAFGGMRGCAHYYDDAGDAHFFHFNRDMYSSERIKVVMESSHKALVISIVEDVLRDMRRSKRSRQE